MSIQHTSEEAWEAIAGENFAVLGMVNRRGAARTVGICYVVDNHKVYIGASKTQWKTKHVSGNPQVSMTVTMARRVPLLPWIKVPAATITFSGTAQVLERDDMSAELVERLHRHDEDTSDWCVIEVSPTSDFITYGLGISVLEMRHPHKARGRAPLHAGSLST